MLVSQNRLDQCFSVRFQQFPKFRSAKLFDEHLMAQPFVMPLPLMPISDVRWVLKAPRKPRKECRQGSLEWSPFLWQRRYTFYFFQRRQIIQLFVGLVWCEFTWRYSTNHCLGRAIGQIAPNHIHCARAGLDYLPGALLRPILVHDQHTNA